MSDERREETRCLPLVSLNHLSFVCSSVARSVKFYEDVLGFISVKRPSALNFEGAWLHNYGIGIHLLEYNSKEGMELPKKKEKINPKDNHISFQCPDMDLLKLKLEKLEIKYVAAVIKENGVKINQLFFHDPDGYMIEICNCDVLPVEPLSAACPLIVPRCNGDERQGKYLEDNSSKNYSSTWITENVR